ncbi:hypothetical protein BpHYR1_053989 [Brachionus plicatilis]|uniref:Uncharacterized protein n=1 Tax=Brachionus plicatilis TaxID=10195 RepID=A0A3M7PV58_BRAPC|nr:hypothetical protein BpHYR1_053989 [Brachionus plicatilis]
MKNTRIKNVARRKNRKFYQSNRCFTGLNACERGDFADFKHEESRGRTVDEFRWRAKWLSELDEDTTSY